MQVPDDVDLNNSFEDVRGIRIVSELTEHGARLIGRKLRNSVVLMVLDVKRYLVDEHFERVARTTFPTHNDAYDLTVTDGVNIVVAVLSPHLDRLVATNAIKPGCVIRVDSVSVRIDEQMIGGEAVTILTEVEPCVISNEVVAEFRHTFTNILESYVPRREPLIGDRGYYLPLLDDDNIDTEALTTVDEADDLDFPNDEEYDVLVNSNKKISAVLGSKNKKATIIGRVISKSNIIHYGRREKNFVLPFYFAFTIVDASYEKGLLVTAWNRLCLEHYHNIQIGDVISIEGYKIKERREIVNNTNSSSNGSSTQLAAQSDGSTDALDSHMDVSDDSGGSVSAANGVTTTSRYELSINSSSPEAVLNKLTDVYEGQNFVRVNFDFRSITELFFTPDGSVVDILGIVLNVTRSERERHFKNPQRFSQHVWIALIDSSYQTSANPTLLQRKLYCKVYTNSNKHIIDNLQVGQIVILPKMQIIGTAADSRVQKRHFVVTSTHNTIIQNEALIQQMASKDAYSEESTNKIHELMDWRDRNIEWFNIFSGGVSTTCGTPIIPFTDYQQYMSAFPGQPWCFFSEVFQIHDELDYLETRTIHIQARIKNITFNPQSESLRALSDTSAATSEPSTSYSVSGLESNTTSLHQTLQRRTTPLLVFTLEDLNMELTLDATCQLWRYRNLQLPEGDGEVLQDISDIPTLFDSVHNALEYLFSESAGSEVLSESFETLTTEVVHYARRQLRQQREERANKRKRGESKQPLDPNEVQTVALHRLCELLVEQVADRSFVFVLKLCRLGHSDVETAVMHMFAPRESGPLRAPSAATSAVRMRESLVPVTAARRRLNV